MPELKREFDKVDYSQIPVYMRRGMMLYLELGIEAGGFLMAVLANDLHFAVKKADQTNRYNLLEYIDFFLDGFPDRSWGSYENVYYWMLNRKAHHADTITQEKIDVLVNSLSEHNDSER